MPTFEGQEVDGYAVIVRQFKGPIDVPLAWGEEVQVNIRGKVIAVTVRENRQTGQLTREHEVKILGIVGDSE